MHVIGLIGGVASGKSLVAAQLARLGAAVLDADRAGHEALRLPEIEAAARRRWGEAVFGADGHVDRARLAQLFSPPRRRPPRAAIPPAIDPSGDRQAAQRADRVVAAGHEGRRTGRRVDFRSRVG